MRLLVLEKVWKNSICLPLGITFRKGRILKRYRYNKAKQKAFLNINMNIEAQKTVGTIGTSWNSRNIKPVTPNNKVNQTS